MSGHVWLNPHRLCVLLLAGAASGACSDPEGKSAAHGSGGANPSDGGTPSGSGGTPTDTDGGVSSGGRALAGGAPAAGGAIFSGGGALGGSPTGGSTSDGGPSSGGVHSGGNQSGGGSAGTGGSEPDLKEPFLDVLEATLLTDDGLTVVSYGGYLNGESFQQDGIVTWDDRQYAAFWNAARHVVVAARQLPDGAWSRLELSDYTNNADDAHNTISLGVSPLDKTLHLAFDHHDDVLHYRRSSVGFLDKPIEEWNPADFGPTHSDLSIAGAIQPVTYPRFITGPDGSSLLLFLRLGQSGSGTSHLFTYSGTTSTWQKVGAVVDGVSQDENPYFHGISYTPGGTRLHLAWCTRATPDASTNHDLYYAYSDDHGVTYRNDAGQLLGTAPIDPISATESSARVWDIPQNRGLINQEHMVVDSEGGVHVLLSHMPDQQADDANFTRARTKSVFFHYYRAPVGSGFTRTALSAPVMENFRGSLAVSRAGNVYAVLPDLRIFVASKSSGYSAFTPLLVDQGRYFSDPLIDLQRVLDHDILSVFYPAKNSGDIFVLDFQLDAGRPTR